jgi:hypothetical protein
VISWGGAQGGTGGGAFAPPPSLYVKKGPEHAKGRRFDSNRGQAYFSSLPGVDIHSE